MNANTVFIMSVLSLFAVFGCSSGGAQQANSIHHGNFTIQRFINTEKGKGKVQNRQFETRSYLVEYGLLYKGNKVKFPGRLQEGTPYNFPWRVYILQDAPTPTILAGSQNMFLVTEEKNELRVTQLNIQRNDFASLQWLDNMSGLPGNELQILDLQNDDFVDSSIILRGGKYLLVNRFTVLDVQSLKKYVFNKKNLYEHEGWRIIADRAAGPQPVVAFSNTWSQVVFGGLKLDIETEGNYFPALISFDYRKDLIHVIPFNRTELRLKSLDDINADWVYKHFEWDDSGTLARKENVVPEPWKGKINFPGESFINYELYPVKESIVHVFTGFLRQVATKNGTNSPFSITDESNPESTQLIYKINYDNKIFHLAYDKKNKKLIFDRHFNEPDSEDYKKTIISVGSKFNAELAQQKHDEHFGKFEGN